MRATGKLTRSRMLAEAGQAQGAETEASSSKRRKTGPAIGESEAASDYHPGPYAGRAEHALDYLDHRNSLAIARFWDSLDDEAYGYIWTGEPREKWLKNRNQARLGFEAEQVFLCKNASGDVIGMAWYRKGIDDITLANGRFVDKDHYVEVAMVVHQDERGNGFGKQLMEIRRQQILENPEISHVLGKVARHNHLQLARLEKSAGWQHIGYDDDADMELFLYALEGRGGIRPSPAEAMDIDSPLSSHSSAEFDSDTIALVPRATPGERENAVSSSLSSLALGDDSDSDYFDRSLAARRTAGTARKDSSESDTPSRVDGLSDDDPSLQILKKIVKCNQWSMDSKSNLTLKETSLLLGLSATDLSHILSPNKGLYLNAEKAATANGRIAALKSAGRLIEGNRPEGEQKRNVLHVPEQLALIPPARSRAYFTKLGRQQTAGARDPSARQVLLLDEYNRQGATRLENLSVIAVSLLLGLSKHGMDGFHYRGDAVTGEQAKAINRQVERLKSEGKLIFGKKRSETPGAPRDTLFLPENFEGIVAGEAAGMPAQATERADKLSPLDPSLTGLRSLLDYNYIGKGEHPFTEGDLSKMLGWDRNQLSSILSDKSNHRLSDALASTANETIGKLREHTKLVSGERRGDQNYPRRDCLYLPPDWDKLVSHSGARLHDVVESRRAERSAKFTDVPRQAILEIQRLNQWTDAELAQQLEVNVNVIGRTFQEGSGVTKFLARKLNAFKQEKEDARLLVQVATGTSRGEAREGQIFWPSEIAKISSTEEALASASTSAQGHEERNLPQIRQLILYNEPLSQKKLGELIGISASSIRNLIHETKPKRVTAPIEKAINGARQKLADEGRLITDRRRKDDLNPSDDVLYWPPHFYLIEETS